MTQIMTIQEFDEQFGAIMLNGLDSQATYIRLRGDKKTGINVGLRPVVSRISTDLLFMGGKLRVGYTLDETLNPIKASVIDLHPEQAANRLSEYCKGFSWQRGDQRRFSTLVGFAVAFGAADGNRALESLTENAIADDFIVRLENQYKQYNDGVGFRGRQRIAAALDAAWRIQMQTYFTIVPPAIPDKVFGKTSKVLNKAQDKYHDNVVSFEKKVSELANATKETNSV